MESKADIRQMMRKLKRQLPMEEKLSISHEIMDHVAQLPAFTAADVVLLYWSMTDEVQTHDFVEQWWRSKTLLLPCVDGDDLLLRRYTGPQCMVAGEQFGIGEPTGDVWTELEKVDLIVVPGVAFDRQCNRMGRGRGFFDRMLKSTPNALKVGVAYDFQLLETIPVEPFDVKMDMVITQHSTLNQRL